MIEQYEKQRIESRDYTGAIGLSRGIDQIPADGNKPPFVYEKYREGKYRIPLGSDITQSDAGPYLLVLDETGRISLLDKQSLDIAGQAGYLPILPEAASKAEPDDLLSYAVMPLSRAGHYMGLACAASSREGRQLRLDVFDPNGKRVSVSRGQLEHNEEIVRAATDVGSILVDSFCPILMTAASMVTADSFEASAGHRGLFFMPNCTVATAVRTNADDPATRAVAIVLIPLPAVILAICIASAIMGDAERLGLSSRARSVWLTASFALGPAAYITWRLTRPKVTLVTCRNCGKGRRPDFERCHLCNAPWVVPELTAPSWRVIGADSEQRDDTSTEQ
jgi:hypothetical protein